MCHQFHKSYESTKLQECSKWEQAHLRDRMIGDGRGGGGEHEARGTGSDFKHAPDLTVRPQPKSQSQWERKVRNKEKERGGENDSDSGKGVKPATWQMACHALTNWATESLGNSVAEFRFLRLSCQGSSWSRYQAGIFDREGVASTKREAQAQNLNMLQTLLHAHSYAWTQASHTTALALHTLLFLKAYFISNTKSY